MFLEAVQNLFYSSDIFFIRNSNSFSLVISVQSLLKELYISINIEVE